MPVGFAARGPIEIPSAGVEAPPDELFGANLWSWHKSNGIIESAGVVTSWSDSSGNARHVSQTGTGATLTTVNGLNAASFTVAAGHALTSTSSVFDLSGITQISVFAVASFRSPTAPFGGFAAYGSTNTANSFDAGSFWLGAVRDNANDALSASGGGGPISLTPGSSPIYRLGTVWNGSTSTFYINLDEFGTPASAAFTPAPAGGATSRLMIGAGISGGGPSFIWDGVLAELIIVTGEVPTAVELESLDLYLKNRFALS